VPESSEPLPLPEEGAAATGAGGAAANQAGSQGKKGAVDAGGAAPQLGSAQEADGGDAGAEAPADEAAPVRTTEPQDEQSDESGVAGAVILGLLGGCLLFGLGLATRKGWMHWRYGL
jgi:hypothetical protein